MLNTYEAVLSPDLGIHFFDVLPPLLQKDCKVLITLLPNQSTGSKSTRNKLKNSKIDLKSPAQLLKILREKHALLDASDLITHANSIRNEWERD